MHAYEWDLKCYEIWKRKKEGISYCLSAVFGSSPLKVQQTSFFRRVVGLVDSFVSAISGDKKEKTASLYPAIDFLTGGGGRVRKTQKLEDER